ncbi:MAG: hypothetical protein IKK36_01745 [Bacteroidales bacterium]|nr:hypothetical protein [Bacteroidales bacterium]
MGNIIITSLLFKSFIIDSISAFLAKPTTGPKGSQVPRWANRRLNIEYLLSELTSTVSSSGTVVSTISPSLSVTSALFLAIIIWSAAIRDEWISSLL